MALYERKAKKGKKKAKPKKGSYHNMAGKEKSLIGDYPGK